MNNPNMQTKPTITQVPRRLWTARNFVRGFKSLQVPITTATEGQIKNWKAEEVWDPYWQSIRDFCDTNVACVELISTVMAPAVNPKLTTLEHRALLQAWVDKYVSGYRIVWESDLVVELNKCLEPYGEKISGFSYGKDGRGALPDRYYHLLARRRLFPVGNHHDILGHFLLFSDPQTRKITEQIIRVSAEGHNIHESMIAFARRTFPRDSQNGQRFDRGVLHPMRPVMALLTFSWNLSQEKLYYSHKANQAGEASSFSLLGAFNTVYNTTFSSRLPVQYAQSTVSGLGVLADTGNRNIIMLPSDMRRWLMGQAYENASPYYNELRANLDQAITAYAETLERVGWRRDPNQEEATAHAARFQKIVMDTLFAHWGPFRLSMRARWKRFGKAIQNDPFFSTILTRASMLKIAEAQIQVAEIAMALRSEHYTSRGGRLIAC